MPQTTPFQTDKIQFNTEGGDTITISSDTDGYLLFQDSVFTTPLKLSDIAGLESAASVIVAGTDKYATIQSALDAVSIASSATNPVVILVAAGVYAESLTLEKDGVTLMGLGRVVITGTVGNPCLSITDAGAAIPLKATFQNIIFSKDQDAEYCVSIVGTDTTALGSGTLTFKDCNFVASGVGTFAFYSTITNKIIIEGGNTTGSTATAKVSVSQCADFIVRGTSELPNVEMSYDDTLDQPSTATSTYSFVRNDLCGDFLVNLSGTGSLSLSSCSIGNLSIDGTQSVDLAQCSAADLTVSGTVTASVRQTQFTSLGGDGTTTLSLDKLIGTESFAAEASKTISLPLPYPDSSYMVLVDGVLGGETPLVENKTTTSFDLTYVNPQTGDAIYQVLKV